MLRRLRPANLALAASILGSLAPAGGGPSLLGPPGPSGPAAAAPAPRIATVMVSFKKRQWRRGDLSSLSFTVTGVTFNGVTPPKVAAFLYVAFDPTPFDSAPTPPQFIGVLEVPSTVVTPVYLSPERNPITEYTRERFVQGAVFNLETGELEGLSNVVYLDIDYEAESEVFAVDFQTEDDFTTPLVNGQSVSTPPEFGNLFDVVTSGGNHLGAAIFDTDPMGPNQFGADPDLLVGLDNALILQSTNTPAQSVPGIFDIPNDSATGGTLSFDFGELQFTRHAELLSLDLIDLCLGANNGAVVTMTDVLGSRIVYTVPPGWTSEINSDGPPGFGTLDLTDLEPQPGFASTATALADPEYIFEETVRVDVELSGSGAVDNFRFAREADPTGPPPPRRTRTR